MHGEPARAGRPDRRERGKDPQARPVGRVGGRLGRNGSIGKRPGRRSVVADHRRNPSRHGCRARRLAADGSARRRGTALAGRVPPFGENRQRHDQAAERVHLRGHPRRPRGRDGRETRRPGAGSRSDRRMEGSHRKRQLDGEQPDGSGAQHRRGDDRGGERGPFEEDHRRRARRNPSAEGGHQYHGRSASLVRLRSHPGGARSGDGGQARRASPGAWSRGNLEGSDRQRQCDVRQSHRPGAQHRPGDDRRGPRRSVPQDHRRRARRNPRAQGHDQYDGGPAERVRLRSDARGARSGDRGKAGRSGEGARRRGDVEGPHRQRQLDGRQSDGPGPQYRGGGDGDCRRRPVEENYGQRQRRDPAAQGDHQHDGRPAQPLRRRGDPGGSRSRNRRPARRPGERHGRGRHLEGPYRKRQFDGFEPDRPGAQYRGSVDRHRQRRSLEEDHRPCQRRDLAAQGDHQYDGRSAERLRGRSDSKSPAKSARTVAWAARRRCPASPEHGKT